MKTVLFDATTGQLPEKILLLRWGENASVQGPIRVGDITEEVLSRDQKTRGFEQVALDFEHNTVPGSEEYNRSQEPRPVAAYGVPRVERGVGLWLEKLKWTPDGEKFARNYTDLSPAVQMNDDKEVVFVHSAALTRNGAVHNLSFPNGLVLHSVRGADRPAQMNNLIVPKTMLADSIRLLSWGDNTGGAGWLTVNETTKELLVRNQIQFGLSRVPITTGGETPKVVAYGIPQVSENYGLRLMDVEWSEEGRSELLKYSALTPHVWTVDEDDQQSDPPVIRRVIIGLRSVELTNTPTIATAYFPQFLKLNAEQQAFVVCCNGRDYREKFMQLLCASRRPAEALFGRQRVAAAINRELAGL